MMHAAMRGAVRAVARRGLRGGFAPAGGAPNGVRGWGLPQARWCAAPAGGQTGEEERQAALTKKIMETDPSMYHLESEGKKLGGQGIGTKNADMALVYECRVCETRAVKQFTRKSYETGVVLIECPGCRNKHVIADNLGWFFDMGEDNNIEKQMRSEGQQLERVSMTPEQYAQFLKGGKIDPATGQMVGEEAGEAPKEGGGEK